MLLSEELLGEPPGGLLKLLPPEEEPPGELLKLLPPEEEPPGPLEFEEVVPPGVVFAVSAVVPGVVPFPATEGRPEVFP